jgi:hypothetical protein
LSGTDGLAAHEARLMRVETFVEMTRPEGAVLRLAPSAATDKSTK